jgi:hypothetical protein
LLGAGAAPEPLEHVLRPVADGFFSPPLEIPVLANPAVGVLARAPPRVLRPVET